MNQQTNIATIGPSLVARMGERFGVDASKLLTTLKATAFKVKDGVVTDEQMMALLVVADQYKLNPFTREIYAFVDRKGGGIVPVVSIDGWARIINEHPQYDGVEFMLDADPGNESMTCTIYRKDRGHATSLTEYGSECYQDTGPWKSHPRRMLRHKAFIQCARVAFGFAGVYDEDEGERIVKNMGMAEVVGAPALSGLERIQAAARAKREKPVKPEEKIDPATGEIAPDATPITYAVFADRLVKTKDAELAGLILDEARELPADQYEDLRAIYARQFKPEA